MSLGHNWLTCCVSSPYFRDIAWKNLKWLGCTPFAHLSTCTHIVLLSVCVTRCSVFLTLRFAPDRVGFLPEETYFFRDTRKKVEETYFFRFYPDKTGRNWTKLWKMSEMLEKKLSYLISHKRVWLQMHLVNWYCLKTWCRKKKTQLPLAYFFQFYPDKTGRNWMTKLIIILIFSQKVMVTNALIWLLLLRNMI